MAKFLAVDEMTELVLASQSPRRQTLLHLLGYPFEVIAADVDEASITDPDPAANAAATAVLKAHAIAQLLQPDERILVAADTTVALAERMFGKPKDAVEAVWMLQALRNRAHEVHTGCVLLDLSSGRRLEWVSTAVVTMRNYTDAEIMTYVASGDPLDKAGAYAVQHPVFQPASRIEGCYTAVMGLPVCDLILALDDWQLPRRADLAVVYQAHQNYSCPIYKKLRKPA
jgi:septum formation protein